jgi:hypothetical protein
LHDTPVETDGDALPGQVVADRVLPSGVGRPLPDGWSTADGPLRARRLSSNVRDRRAGNRAVNDWSNHNTADLRRLAAQITTLDDLAPASAGEIARLNDALADTDATALPALWPTLAGTSTPTQGWPEGSMASPLTPPGYATKPNSTETPARPRQPEPGP